MSVAIGTDRLGRAVARKQVGLAVATHIADLLVRKQAEVLDAARHPGTVELLGIEPTAGPHGEPRLVLVLGAVEGPRLDEVALSPTEVSGVIAALSSIVADLHDRSVVHGAVRAEHVILENGVRPRLCGFGSARRLRDDRPRHEGGGESARLPTKEDDVFALAMLGRSLLAASAAAAAPLLIASTDPEGVSSTSSASADQLARLRTTSARRSHLLRRRSTGTRGERRAPSGARHGRDHSRSATRMLSAILTATPRQRPTARQLANLMARQPGACLPRARALPPGDAEQAGARGSPVRSEIPTHDEAPYAPNRGDSADAAAQGRRDDGPPQAAALASPLGGRARRADRVDSSAAEARPEATVSGPEMTVSGLEALASPTALTEERAGEAGGRPDQRSRRGDLASRVAVLSGVIALSAAGAAVWHRLRPVHGAQRAVHTAQRGVERVLAPTLRPTATSIPFGASIPSSAASTSASAGSAGSAVRTLAATTLSPSTAKGPTGSLAPPCAMPQKALKAKKGRAAALADVDQTGCGAAVVVRGTTLRVGSSAFALGGPDDRATVGDWNCDGWVTPALLARSTGSLYRYDTWPAPGKPLAGVALGPIPHAVAVRAVSRDGCDDLLVTRDDGSSVVVSARPDPQSRGRTSP